MINGELFDRYKETGDINIRNEIVEKYLYMVEVLIRKYLNKGVDYDDLYQVGAMALVSAVERFDPSKGFEFSSFATPTILGEIKKYFRDRRQKEISLKIPAAKEELYEKLGRAPTVAELSEHLGYSEEDILQAIESGQAYGAYSLNQTFDETGEDGAIFEKYTAMNELGYDRFEMAQLINSVVTKFSENEKLVFRWRFLENITQSEIAERLAVSQMTVSRLEKGIKQKFLNELKK